MDINTILLIGFFIVSFLLYDIKKLLTRIVDGLANIYKQLEEIDLRLGDIEGSKEMILSENLKELKQINENLEKIESATDVICDEVTHE